MSCTQAERHHQVPALGCQFQIDRCLPLLSWLRGSVSFSTCHQMSVVVKTGGCIHGDVSHLLCVFQNSMAKKNQVKLILISMATKKQNKTENKCCKDVEYGILMYFRWECKIV